VVSLVAAQVQKRVVDFLEEVLVQERAAEVSLAGQCVQQLKAVEEDVDKIGYYGINKSIL
jgi:hypothetical protein